MLAVELHLEADGTHTKEENPRHVLALMTL
jgi:hypothetical protein